MVEARYVGNHAADLWSAVNLNEVNTVENGFATQFQAAQNNLAIANGISVPQLLLSAASGTGIKLTSNNYGNQGLPGQVNVPLLTTAIGSSTDQTTVPLSSLPRASPAQPLTVSRPMPRAWPR